MAEVERDGARILVPGTWRLPDTKLLPELLEQGRAVMAMRLAPAGIEGVASALMPLLLTATMPSMEHLRTAEDTDETYDRKCQALLGAKVAEYQRLMSHLPADIIRSACDAHVLENKFFPAIAELMKHARPAFELRQRQADRIDRLIAQSRAPKKAEPFKADPPEVRHRAAIERFHKYKGGTMHDSLRRSAIEGEQWLAKQEGREPNIEQFGTATPAITTPIPPMPRRPTAKPVIEGQAETIAAGSRVGPEHVAEPYRRPAPAPWRYGEPVYQTRPEEPPLPDEIPE